MRPQPRAQWSGLGARTRGLRRAGDRHGHPAYGCRRTSQGYSRTRPDARAQMKKAPEGSGASGVPVGRTLLHRPDHHHHLATFHPRHVLDLAEVLDVVGDPFEQFPAEVLVRHLAAAKPHGDLHLVALFEKLHDIAHLDVVVVGVGVGAELHFLDLDGRLLLAGLALALLGLVLVLAEIHDLADRRRGVWRDLDEIEPRLLGHLHGAGRCHDTDIFTVCADEADFGGADTVVD